MTREENGREYSCGDNCQLYVVEKNKFTVRKNEGVLAEGTIELNAARSPWRPPNGRRPQQISGMDTGWRPLS